MNRHRKILGYIVLASNDRVRLEKWIIEWSEEGYELYGNPFTTGEGGYLELCQPMVKYERE